MLGNTITHTKLIEVTVTEKKCNGFFKRTVKHKGKIHRILRHYEDEGYTEIELRRSPCGHVVLEKPYLRTVVGQGWTWNMTCPTCKCTY